ncbi:hypothetical protein CBL_08414 [Carabus blaptoides fortunei]
MVVKEDEGLNPTLYSETVNVQAFFQVCEDLIHAELQPRNDQAGAETRDIKPELIMNGTKILLMEIYNVRFINSLNFLPMSLASLVKALDLPPSLKKGYFPHLFNTAENSSYVGPLPDVEFYGANNMHSDHREQFLKWHAGKVRENYIFNMSAEIVEYCMWDVDILRRACEKFRKTFINNREVCQFTEAVTITSACSKVFQRRFLKHRTIGLIPSGGDRMRDTQSRVALEWLIWEEETRQIRIDHAARVREAVLDGGFKVDGYYAPGKLFFEFHGCFHHGHNLCFRIKRDDPILNNPQEITKLAIVYFLCGNQALRNNKNSPANPNAIKEAYEQLTVGFNSLGGPERTPNVWKRVFAVWKIQTKKKARLINNSRLRTGGGPSSSTQLSQIEKRLLDTIGRTVADGGPNIPKAGINIILIENLEEVPVIIVEEPLLEETDVIM